MDYKELDVGALHLDCCFLDGTAPLPAKRCRSAHFCFRAMRASPSSLSGALCFTRKLSTHSGAKSRWSRQLMAAVMHIVTSAPRL